MRGIYVSQYTAGKMKKESAVHIKNAFGYERWNDRKTTESMVATTEKKEL